MAGRNRDGEGQDHQGDLLQPYVPDTAQPAVDTADGQKILSAIDDLKKLLAARHDAEPAPSPVNGTSLESILEAIEGLRTAQERTSAALDPETPDNIPAAIAGLRAALDKPEPETEPAFVKPLISTLENNSAVLKSTRTDLDAVMKQTKTSAAAIQGFQEQLNKLDGKLDSAAPSHEKLEDWRDSFMIGLGKKLAEAQITGRDATGRDPGDPETLIRLDNWRDNFMRDLRKELSRIPSADTGAAALPATQDAARAVAVYDTVSTKVTMLESELGKRLETLESSFAGVQEQAKKTGDKAESLEKKFGSFQKSIPGLTREIRDATDKLRFTWRVFLSPWAIVVFFLGMLFESKILVLYNWFWRP